jgi:HEAT repeat protein
MTSQLQSLWTQVRLRLMTSSPVEPAQLQDADPTVRWRAVRRLAGRPQSQHRDALLDLLGDPDPIIRDESVRALASWGPNYGLMPARAGLEGKPEQTLAISLLDLLANLPDPDNQAVIVPYLSHTDPLVRTAAAHAAGALGMLQDHRILLPLLADADPRVRRAACTALGQITDPGALPALRQQLHDSDELTRASSQRAISQIEAAEADRQAKSRRSAAPPPSSSDTGTGPTP